MALESLPVPCDRGEPSQEQLPFEKLKGYVVVSIVGGTPSST